MPSLGRTFGGNGDLVGAWFKDSAEPVTFTSPPVLGRFNVDGLGVPFTGIGGLPLWRSLPLPPREKEVGEDVPYGWHGRGYRKSVSWLCQWEQAGIDYDPDQQPIFDQIRIIPRAGDPERLKTWAIAKPFTFSNT